MTIVDASSRYDDVSHVYSEAEILRGFNRQRSAERRRRRRRHELLVRVAIALLALAVVLDSVLFVWEYLHA